MKNRKENLKEALNLLENLEDNSDIIIPASKRVEAQDTVKNAVADAMFLYELMDQFGLSYAQVREACLLFNQRGSVSLDSLQKDHDSLVYLKEQAHVSKSSSYGSFFGGVLKVTIPFKAEDYSKLDRIFHLSKEVK